MWQLLSILALVICSEAMPKKYVGIPLKKSQNVKAISDENRLDQNSVQPQNYKIDLTVSQDNLDNGNFSGTVAITLTVAAEKITSFNIHAKYLTIDADSATLKKTGFDGKITTEGPNPNNDFLTIKSDKEIPIGKDYVLTISYTGILSDTDMEGFYRSYYTDDNNAVKYLATTQFEQMGARRAFPCFDEPFFKATFDITISYSVGYNAMSNTQRGPEENASGGLKKVTFATTPVMSTYIVAFIVSDFQCIPGNETSDKIPTEVCARPEAQDTMKLALDATPIALDTMKELTGYEYGQLGNKKMTQAAIPDFLVGAMENWGMVTYREADLLWDEKDSSNRDKQVVVGDILHEFAHHWFGDYVTLSWWSDAFLNEGFATYFEYFGAAKVQPDWDFEKQFIIEEVQPVLLTDSSGESKALSSNVSDPDDIKAKFSDISYNKGGSIIRMVQNFLGQDNFKKGVTQYLGTHGGKVVTPLDLWKSFNDFKPEDVPDNVETVMDTWTYQPGYPLLTLKQNGANITITQEEFLLTGNNGTTKWYVPITYTTSNDTKFTDTTTQEWLLPDQDLVISLASEDDWIILNNQQVGYYRVNYDDTLLGKIETALNNKLDDIDEISRSQLVDDQMNLAGAGKKEYKDVLEFLKFLKKDTSYYSWSSAFNGFSYFLKRTKSDEIRKFLTAYITELMDAVLKDKSVTAIASAKQIDVLGQVLALTWACNLDVGTYVKDARDAFVDYIANETLIPDPNLRSIIYCNGLRNSENALEDYNFLFNKYTSTKLATEQVTILKALGCINDSELRKQYLKEALGTKIRLQDTQFVFKSVYSNNGAEGVNDVVNFISENYKDFEKRFGTKSTLNNLIHAVADLFTTQDQVEKLKIFQEIGELDESIKTAATEAVKSAESNLQEISSLETKFKDYFQPNSASMNTNHLVHLAIIGVVYLIFNFH